MSTSRPSSCGAAPRLADDHGAVAVEFALILPLFIVVICGLVDFGVGFRNRVSIQGAARNAARSEASLGPNVNADQFALSTLWAGMTNVPNITITKVIVFKSDNTGALPSGCLTTTVDASGVTNCNVYGATRVRNASTTFSQAGTSCSSSGWDFQYCPYTRKNTLASPPDYLGLYTEVAYTPFTRIFSSSITLTDKVIVRLEPPAG